MLGQRHFDVQIMGGAALHLGWVAEMKTGEGKTLVATLPSYLNALAGRGVHLITVNDYLAKRDAEWMGRLHRFLGLRSARHPRRLDARREARAVRLRHHLRHEQRVRLRLPPRQHGRAHRGPDAARQARPVARAALLRDRRRGRLDPHRRGPHAADHLGPGRRRRRALLPVRPHRARLQRDRDYEVDEAKRTVVPTEEGIGASSRRSASTTSTSTSTRTSCTSSSRRCAARSCSSATSTTSSQDGEVKIVDEFTGRILEGRRWSEGLHQAVEAKEGVQIKEENQTLATVTLQNYFRMYEKLSGMTGTAYTEAGEFAHTYNLQVVSIPTNRPMVRADERRPHLQERGREVRRRGRRHRRAPREGPAGPRRHDLGREVREAVAAAREARHPARGAQRQAARAGSRDRHPGGQARRPSPSPPTWPAAASTSSSAATPRAWRAASASQRRARRSTREEDEARYDELLPRFQAECKVEGDKVRELRRPLRARHRAPRVAPHRQPAARPLRPPGRPRREPLLPLARRRADAPVRDRAHAAGDGQVVPRRRAARGEDGLEGDRARAEHGRGPQLRDPQGRAQVRRGDERAAQGHLPAPPADPRRRGPARRRARGDRVGDRPPRRSVLRRRVRRGVGPRGAARRRRKTYFPTRVTKEQLDAVTATTRRWRSCSSTTRSRCTRRRKSRSAPRRCATSSAA